MGFRFVLAGGGAFFRLNRDGFGGAFFRLKRDGFFRGVRGLGAFLRGAARGVSHAQRDLETSVEARPRNSQLRDEQWVPPRRASRKGSCT